MAMDVGTYTDLCIQRGGTWRDRSTACGTSVGDGWPESSRTELLAVGAIQRCPGGLLHRPPRRALPARTDGTGWRVLHARHIERRPPAFLIVLSQLQVKALTVHAYCDVTDAGPRVEPHAQRP